MNIDEMCLWALWGAEFKTHPLLQNSHYFGYSIKHLIGYYDEGTSQAELRLLIFWPKNKEIVLDYLGKPNVITWAFKSIRSIREEAEEKNRRAEADK